MKHRRGWFPGIRQRDRRGVAALEFALVAPVVVVLLVGVFDIGFAVEQNMILAAAVQAGGRYALSYPTILGNSSACPATSTSNPTPPTSAACAITQALPGSWSVTPSISCTCWDSSHGYSTVSSCSSVSECPSSTQERFVNLTASRPYTWLPSTSFTTLSSGSVSYVVRIQ